MDDTLTPPSLDRHIPPSWFVWLPTLLGLAILYLPTYWYLANHTWTQDEHAHGPLILIVALYLAWQQREVFLRTTPSPAQLVGWPIAIFGLLLYALGRSQEIVIMEIGSQIPVLLGTLLITLGWRAVRTLWFPLLFLVFMIPLPGFMVDAATGPLKHQVSVLAEGILYLFDYPIARNGVVLTIGPYQLLVADACSGLHSMFSLSALGLLYVHLMQHRSWLRNGILIAAILPIAFAANVARVIILVLVTYHFGDAAAQGIVHDSAGILLFVVALLLLFGLDSLLGLLPGRHNRPGTGKP
ncbi:MAG: exosortase B [Hydrogenophilaceae bacterium]|nr:exosortase B [Hydrogenophilaceae bacterium]